VIHDGSDEKRRLQRVMWKEPDTLSREIVAQPATKIAELADIDVPENTPFLVVEESGIGNDYPFSREKLSPVLTLYRWDDFDRAVEMVNEITDFSGAGHSCGIHTTDEKKALKLAEKVKISRVMVNQPQCLANSGAWTNGMPMTLSLGCGTWGNNSTSDNIDWTKLINTTWVSWPIASTQPSDEDLFPADVLSESWD